ncbi:hypothetical protein [Streptomyces sp. Sce081]|uniref:hypothetical protein n=1 Tax=Streptomyces sp. Sce081 TaxID=3349853 RepID=UPI0035F34DFC
MVRDRSLSLFGTVWPEVYGTRHLGAVRSPVVAVLVFASALGPGAGACFSTPVPANRPSSSRWAGTA